MLKAVSVAEAQASPTTVTSNNVVKSLFFIGLPLKATRLAWKNMSRAFFKFLPESNVTLGVNA
jgi:hypothetical protein